MPVTARDAALRALGSVRRGARPDMVLANIGGLEPRDMALAAKIVNGVLQNEMFLDHYIALYARRDTAALEPEILDILRLSSYQLIFLSRIPARAAVAEGVALAKRRKPWAAGLVNAVLRRVAENKDALPAIAAENESKRLSITYSHPIWLVEELIAQFGTEDAAGILRADNTEPAVTAQVNTLKTCPEDLLMKLRSIGLAARISPNYGAALELENPGPLAGLEPFRDGLFYVQDLAARMAVKAAGVRPGMRVLDICSAPGGKSFACAMDMENRGEILAFDIHEKKLGLVREGAKRLGIDIIRTSPGNGRVRAPELVDSADAVICDVPCSGLGVIRKKPEIRYKDRDELDGLPEVQLGILANAAGYVKTGGVLLYSTCTLRRAENEEVIESFLEDNGSFALEPFELPGAFGGCGGMMTILPHKFDTDGFFICKMRRLK